MVKKKRSKTTSYLIIFKIEGFRLELIETLYIPQHGNSVISEYTNNVVLFPRLGDTSGVHMRFGKCVNTSN